MSSVQVAEAPDPTWPETWPRTADEIHVFDIQGDVLLKLVRHAEVDEESDTPSPPPPPPDEAAPAVQEPDEDAQPDDDSVHSDDSASSAGALTDVHMRVSSKHIILASSTFRSMLGPGFEEGQRLRTEGSTDIALGDDDPDAFEILLNIIHGLTRKVPRSVSLEMLTKLAVLVNYYQMHEAVELFSDTWIDSLVKEGLPQSHSSETGRWLLIAWVFDKPLEFRAMSRVIEFGCDETLEDDFDESWPVPAPIIDVILAHRAAAIEGAMHIVHSLIARYSSPEVFCPAVWDVNNNLACDSLLLGSLIKGSATIGIWPKINPPYLGVVFQDLAIQIRELKVFDVCNQERRRYQSCYDAHGVKDSIEASLSALEGAMHGLKLEDFLPEQAFIGQ